MKTVLIVEDEKLIRQGLRKMIQRSGVPVEVIMECNNGETALEILKEQSIDVMFTDIRMPKMDGIELVERMQECEHIPLTVAISGYDDFNYAVAMMHNGVREYLLKPIEREKICDILARLNQEIEEGREQEKTRQKLGQQQIRHLMLLAEMPEEELTMLETQYDQHFILDLGGKPYVVCRNRKKRRNPARRTACSWAMSREMISFNRGGKHFRTVRGISFCRNIPESAGRIRESANCARHIWRRGNAQVRVLHEPQSDALWAGDAACPTEAGAGGVKAGCRRDETAAGAVTWNRPHRGTTARLDAIFYEVKHGRIGVRDFEGVHDGFPYGDVKTYRNVLEEKKNCGEIKEITDPFWGGRNRPLRTEGAGIC